MKQNNKYTEIMKQLNYKPIGSVLLRLCGVVKRFFTLNKQVLTEEEKDLKRRRNHYPFG